MEKLIMPEAKSAIKGNSVKKEQTQAFASVFSTLKIKSTGKASHSEMMWGKSTHRENDSKYQKWQERLLTKRIKA